MEKFLSIFKKVLGLVFIEAALTMFGSLFYLPSMGLVYEAFTMGWLFSHVIFIVGGSSAVLLFMGIGS